MHINNELFYNLKDTFMIEFLKDDIDTIKLNLLRPNNEDDEIDDKNLLKAYTMILKYYGVENG